MLGQLLLQGCPSTGLSTYCRQPIALVHIGFSGGQVSGSAKLRVKFAPPLAHTHGVQRFRVTVAIPAKTASVLALVEASYEGLVPAQGIPKAGYQES